MCVCMNSGDQMCTTSFLFVRRPYCAKPGSFVNNPSRFVRPLDGLGRRTQVRVAADKSGVEVANVKMSMNPFCEIAVEEAVSLGLTREVRSATVHRHKERDNCNAEQTRILVGIVWPSL